MSLLAVKTKVSLHGLLVLHQVTATDGVRYRDGLFLLWSDVSPAEGSLELLS